MKPFKTEKYNDFTKAANRKKMEKAIAQVESQFGKEYSSVTRSKSEIISEIVLAVLNKVDFQ